jgi:ribokinase
VSAEVVVVGSFMGDLVIRAPRRPRPGETLVGHSLEQFFGGKGCNQAVAAARTGAGVAMVGRVGDDDHGRQFLALLAREGIDAAHVVVDPDEGTGIGAPVVEDSGDNSIVIVPRANRRLTEADVLAAASSIAAARVLLVQLEVPADASATAARIAREAGTVVVLNPAPAASLDELAPFEGLVDVLVPNEGEAALLTGIDGDPLAAAKALQGRFGTEVAVTLGERGSLVLYANGDHEELPAHVVDAVDTVGAGDAYCGSLGARLASGAEMRAAARYAGAAGALAVTRRGAEPSLPTAAEVAALLDPR